LQRNKKSRKYLRTQSLGLRLDQFLKATFPFLTGRQIDEAIDRGLVLNINGGHCKKGERISSGNNFNLAPLEEHLKLLGQGNSALKVEVITEEEDFAVVDKPAGMPSHPISLFDYATVTQWALRYYPGILAEFPGAQQTITPHRLDTGTSGLLVVAKNRKGFEGWRHSFHRKAVSKKYLAWCWGCPDRQVFEATKSIGHDGADRRKMTTDKARVRGPYQEAFSVVRVIETYAEQALFLAEITCKTGVTHQVRVHMASAGFPLVGDSLYDNEASERGWRPSYHQLRAVSLTRGEFSVWAPMASFLSEVTAIGLIAPSYRGEDGEI
jgi:23S rRNA pseudouridine1911/1915/1917 synthase